MAKLRALLHLATLFVRSPSTGRLAADALRVAIALRRRGLKAVLPDQSSPLPEAAPARARALAEQVDTAFAALPFEPTCLRRSATLLRALHRSGTSGDLVIGVRTDDEPTGFGAHAWVEIAGTPINDDADMRERYTVLATGGELGELPAGLR